MSADRPCAWAIAKLIGEPFDGALQSRVRQAFAAALTHPVHEVRSYAASAIGTVLGAENRDLALHCARALAMEATLIQRAADGERPRSAPRRAQGGDIEADAAAVIRRGFYEPNRIPDDALETFDPSRWFGAEASANILAILRRVPSEPTTIATFERLARTLVGWWDSDHDHQRHDGGRHRERNYQTEPTLSYLIEDFLLRTSRAAAATIVQPFLDAIDRHPREVEQVLLGMIGVRLF